MQLFVGLGNPGAKYAHHRHNIGYMAVDAIAADHGFGPWRRKFQADVAEGRLGGGKVLLIKPQTFMNRSGQSVGEAMRYLKLAPEDIWVFHDELDLAPGKLRAKQGGGHAGHNGLRSLDAHIGRDYRRVRLGIGHPGHKDQVHPYVLRDFPKAEEPLVAKVVDAVAGEIGRLIADDDGGFMSRVAHLITPPRPKPPPKPAPPKPAPPDSGKPETDAKDETAATDGK